MATPHIQPRALSALLSLAGEDKIQLAMRAQMSAGHLRDLETFRNKGQSAAVRRRIANAFRSSEVRASSITCWCDRPGGVCRALLEGDA